MVTKESQCHCGHGSNNRSSVQKVKFCFIMSQLSKAEWREAETKLPPACVSIILCPENAYTDLVIELKCQLLQVSGGNGVKKLVKLQMEF